jgi:hypothetical protein
MKKCTLNFVGLLAIGIFISSCGSKATKTEITENNYQSGNDIKMIVVRCWLIWF